MSKLESLKTIVQNGIDTFENEYPNKSKEEQKKILRTETINFATVGSACDYENFDADDLMALGKDFEKYAILLQIAWNEF